MSNGQISSSHAILLDLITASTSNSATISNHLDELRSTLTPCIHAIKDLSDLSKSLATEIQQSLHGSTHQLDARLANIEKDVERKSFQAQEVQEGSTVGHGRVEHYLNTINETQVGCAKTQDVLANSISELKSIFQDMHAQDTCYRKSKIAKDAEQCLRTRKTLDDIKSILLRNAAPSQIAPSIDATTSIPTQDILISKLRHTRMGIEIAIEKLESAELTRIYVC